MTDLESAAAEIVRELVNANLAEDGYGGFSKEDWRGLGVRHYDEAIARIVVLAQDHAVAGSEALLAPVREQFAAVASLAPPSPPVRREHSPL